MAIFVEEICPFRLKEPAPFMLSALNINGAAFYINAVFLLIGTFLFAQPKPLEFTEQRIASESYETVGCTMWSITEKRYYPSGKNGLNIYYNEPIKQ